MGVAGLAAIEIDPQAAAAAYQRRSSARCGPLPDAEIAASPGNSPGRAPRGGLVQREFTDLLADDSLTGAL